MPMKRLSFEQPLRWYFRMHDPTTLDRQGVHQAPEQGGEVGRPRSKMVAQYWKAEVDYQAIPALPAAGIGPRRLGLRGLSGQGRDQFVEELDAGAQARGRDALVDAVVAAAVGVGDRVRQEAV